MALTSKLKIAVLAGGESAERAVSLNSGAAVTAALAGRGHKVVEIDPADDALHEVSWSVFDAVFLALHGEFGEDGEIQEILEAAGVPYTGSDADASRLAFSKSASKERFAQHGVATPESVLIHETDDAARISRQAARIGFPLVVKPDAQGSSIGVSLVQTPEELPQGLTRCFSLGPFGLLETLVEGEEWTVGVLDDHAFPPVRIETDRGFYDYDAKYIEETTRYHFDCEDADRLDAVRRAGQHACMAVGTKGVARADVMLDRQGRAWVLEVNTIPGFTSHSLIPKAAAREGVEFAELCERAIASCLRTAQVEAPPTRCAA